MVKIYGLQKLSLVDYPGKTAAVLFTGGCNFKCPYCHNSGLLSLSDPPLDYDGVFAYLRKRKGVLDAVVVSGGEPLIHNDTIYLLEELKKLGYSVKLDTNGSYPLRLAEAVAAGFVDYVAMDIKNSLEKYHLTADAHVDTDAVKKSVMYLMSGAVGFEFRTTVVAQLHTEEDFESIGALVAGDEKYYLQRFKDSEGVKYENLSAPSDTEMQKYLKALLKFVPNAELRG